MKKPRAWKPLAGSVRENAIIRELRDAIDQQDRALATLQGDLARVLKNQNASIPRIGAIEPPQASKCCGDNEDVVREIGLGAGTPSDSCSWITGGAAVDVDTRTLISRLRFYLLAPATDALYRVECWKMTGLTLTERVAWGESVPITTQATPEGHWAEVDGLRWDLLPGQRYGFLVSKVDGGDVVLALSADVALEHVPGLGQVVAGHFHTDAPIVAGLTLSDNPDFRARFTLFPDGEVPPHSHPMSDITDFDLALGDLSDVDTSNSADGNVLTYDSVTQMAQWEPPQGGDETPKLDLTFDTASTMADVYSTFNKTAGVAVSIGAESVVTRYQPRIAAASGVGNYRISCFRLSGTTLDTLVGEAMATYPGGATGGYLLDTGPVVWPLAAGARYAFLTTYEGGSFHHRIYTNQTPRAMVGFGTIPAPGLVRSTLDPAAGGTVTIDTVYGRDSAQGRISVQVAAVVAIGAHVYLSTASVAAVNGWRNVVFNAEQMRGPTHTFNSTTGTVTVSESGWYALEARVDNGATAKAGRHALEIMLDGVATVRGDDRTGLSNAIQVGGAAFITGGQAISVRYFSDDAGAGAPLAGGTSDKTYLRLARIRP